MQSTRAGDHPVNLLVLDGMAAAQLQDAEAPTNVRAVHAVSDVDLVDMALDDDYSFIEDLDFKEVAPDQTATEYVSTMPGNYNIKVAPANTMNNVIDVSLDYETGEAYTVLALGTLAGATEMIEPMRLTDDNRSVATEARLRVVHASTLAMNVDVHLTATADLTGATPALVDVPFMAESGYLSVAEGDYFVTATPTGTQTAAIAVGPVNLANGGDISNLILLDDF